MLRALIEIDQATAKVRGFHLFWSAPSPVIMAHRNKNNDETLHSRHGSSLMENTRFGSETSKVPACRSLPPLLQDILDQADEDESVYEDFWAPK